jgi:hypothetical protein
VTRWHYAMLRHQGIIDLHRQENANNLIRFITSLKKDYLPSLHTRSAIYWFGYMQLEIEGNCGSLALFNVTPSAHIGLHI